MAKKNPMKKVPGIKKSAPVKASPKSGRKTKGGY